MASQRLGDSLDFFWMRDRDLLIAAQSDGLQVFRSHHRADPAASGMTSFVADRGKTHSIFASFADGRDPRSGSIQL